MPSSSTTPIPHCGTCPVRHQAICAALADTELPALSAVAAVVTIASGQEIFFEGDRVSHVFNVTRGAVRLSKLLPDGRRQVTGFLFPGDLLGLSVSGVYAYTADAIAETSLCRVDHRRLSRVAEQYPKLEHRLLAMASNDLTEAQEHLVLLGRKRANERVATVLMGLALRIGRETQGAIIVDLPMSREDMADYTGLTIETVSRHLTRLRESGIVEIVGSRQILIPRIDALAELSGDV